jgi:hypothetical protein
MVERCFDQDSLLAVVTPSLVHLLLAVSKVEIKSGWRSLPRKYHVLAFGWLKGYLPFIGPRFLAAKVPIQAGNNCVDTI